MYCMAIRAATLSLIGSIYQYQFLTYNIYAASWDLYYIILLSEHLAIIAISDHWK